MNIKFYALCKKGDSRTTAGKFYSVWDMFWSNGLLYYVIVNDSKQHSAVPADYFEYYSETKPKEESAGKAAQNIGGSYLPTPKPKPNIKNNPAPAKKKK